MDGKGRALDNIFTERLWRSVKYEEVYLNDYANPKQARRGLAEYLVFYDYRRSHQSLNDQTPAAVYYGHVDDRATTLPWPQAMAYGCKPGLWVSGQLPKSSSRPLTHSFYYRIYPEADP